tara:strand:- start:1644 stop:1964 length:321 start_codon:yes stop_codon:yes gene_type:complete
LQYEPSRTRFPHERLFSDPILEKTISKRLILASALSVAMASPALAATCDEQLVLLDVLMATEGDALEPEINNRIISLRNKANDAKTAGYEDACLENAEEALSPFSQ